MDVSGCGGGQVARCPAWTSATRWWTGREVPCVDVSDFFSGVRWWFPWVERRVRGYKHVFRAVSGTPGNCPMMMRE